MHGHSLYEAPRLFDRIMPPGACEAFYRPLARRVGGPVLELACGTGRLAIPLALDGHAVVGLDLSPAMLGAARDRARAAGVTVEFVTGDMRSFELGRRFALVVVACNSLAHLMTPEELVGTLRRIARHLAPDGLLAFDVVNPRLSVLAGETDRSILLQEDGVTVVEEVLAYDPVAQVRQVQWQVDAAGAPPCRTDAMPLRMVFPQELALLLSSAGFDLVARCGDFDGAELTRDSLTQVCIARPRRAGVP